MFTTVDLLLFSNMVVLLLLGLSFWQISKLWIELKAMKNSTHQISYINPLSEDFQKINDKQKKDLVGSGLELIPEDEM